MLLSDLMTYKVRGAQSQENEAGLLIRQSACCDGHCEKRCHHPPKTRPGGQAGCSGKMPVQTPQPPGMRGRMVLFLVEMYPKPKPAIAKAGVSWLTEVFIPNETIYHTSVAISRKRLS